MKVYFINHTKNSVKEYRQIINQIFKPIKSEFYFNVIFVLQDEIRDLNAKYRGIDRETDVITFSLLENEDEIFEGTEFELGDVFISIPQAVKQASLYGHSIEREVAFLSVHGYLHLKGYDHQTKEQEEEMFSLQEQILEEAGFTR